MPYEWDYMHTNRVRLDPSWPGLQAPAGEVKVDPDALEQLGRMLVSQASSLESDNSHLPSGVSYLDDARRSTTVGLEQATDPAGEQWFGTWRTAVLMRHSLTTAQGSILHYYQLLAGQLRAAGTLLDATANAYRENDNRVEVELEAALTAGWSQVAQPADPPGGPSPGLLRESTQVPYISEYEDVSQYDPQWVMQQIEAVRQSQAWVKLSSAGGAFGAAGDRLAGVARTLKSQAESLMAEWESETSVACQQALQRIAGTADHLAESSQSMANFANRSAEVLQERVSGFPTDLDRSAWETVTDTLTIGSNPDQERKENEVRDALALLNEAYRDVNYTTLPGQVAVDLPLLPEAAGDTFRVSPPPPYQPPGAPVLPNPPLSPTPASTGMPATGSGPAVGTGITGFPGAGEPVGVGSGAGLGGPASDIPGVVGMPGEGADWSPGGLAGAGSGPVPTGPGGVAPGGGAGIGPAGLNPGGGVPGPTGPGLATGPGPVGMPPGAGRGGAANAPPGGRNIPGIGPGAGARPGSGVVPMGTGGGQNPGGRTSAGPGGRPGAANAPGTALGRPATGSGGLAGAGGGGGRPGGTAGMMPMRGGGGARDNEKRRTGSRAGAVGAASGAAGGAAASGAAGAGAAGRPGGMAPMAAGRSSDRDDEATHDTWLVEDEDPWRGDDEAPPPVIK